MEDNIREDLVDEFVEDFFFGWQDAIDLSMVIESFLSRRNFNEDEQDLAYEKINARFKELER